MCIRDSVFPDCIKNWHLVGAPHGDGQRVTSGAVWIWCEKARDRDAEGAERVGTGRGVPLKGCFSPLPTRALMRERRKIIAGSGALTLFSAGISSLQKTTLVPSKRYRTPCGRFAKFSKRLFVSSIIMQICFSRLSLVPCRRRPITSVWSVL